MVSGNLTRDASVRQSQVGTTVLGFGVAVNDRRRNAQTGEWEDYPNFIDCTMFGQRAQAISPHLTKGVKVAIEGKLRYSSWERDGQKRSKIEIVVEDLEFMSRREQAGNSQGVNPQVAYAAQQAQAATQRDVAPTLYDSDIPF